MPQRYKRPPIVEAVIAITVKQPVELDELEKLHKRFLEDYPTPPQRILQPTSFEIELGEGETKIKQQATPGIRMASGDAAGVLLLMSNGLTTSRLAPYEGWEPFYARARKNWDLWRRHLDWREIVRVGVRYINRLDIPTESENDVVPLDKYLAVIPKMPPVGLPPLNHFTVNTENPLGKDNCKLILNVGSTPSPLVKTVSFLLDIDIVADSNLPQSDNEIWALIERIRGYKNMVFEASITDQLRAHFSS